MTPDELEEIRGHWTRVAAARQQEDIGTALADMTPLGAELTRGLEDVQALLGYVDDLYNGLCWIRYQAALHYLGGAFEPVHMQAIANTAGDLLAGRVLPDYTSVIDSAQEKATEWAERFAGIADTEEKP